ncbi:MAG: methyltransferase domain-containing protein [Planctomycetota bacterium]
MLPMSDPLLVTIPAEVLEHDCGCGSAWKWAREGETALDLGCGSGKTCFLLSSAVGSSGRVIGVDASPAMLDVARRNQSEVARAVGCSNVRFVEARIQDVGEAVGAGSADLVVLDCVLTFVPARERAEILSAASAALRPGGRAIVSDVLALDLEGVLAALAEAGFASVDVIERYAEVRRVIDGVPRFATTIRACLGNS